MTTTTIENLTHYQVTTLRREAAEAGDEATVTDCDLVLEHYDMLEADTVKGVYEAAERVAAVIRDAAAQN